MSKSNKKSSSLLKGSALTAGLTLVSRIAGFLRDLLMASLLGTGFYADSFLVAFRLPNLLRSFFAEGALTSGFVPTISDEQSKSDEQAQKALSEVFGALFAVLSIIVLVGIFYSGIITKLFAPGFVENPDKFELTVFLTRIMLPYIVFVSIVALANAALNVKLIFGMASLAQILMNVVLILGALVAYYATDLRQASIFLACSVLVGGVVQVVLQFILLRKAGFNLIPRFNFRSKAVSQTTVLMVPALFGGAIYQITVFTNTQFATLLPEGSVSWLFYADRVAQLPVGVFTMAVASVLLPLLAKSASNNETGEFSRNILNSLRYTSLVILIVSGIFFLESEKIVQLLFQRNKFDSYSTFQTSKALKVLCFGLWSMSCHSLFVRTFLAKKQPIIPTMVAVVSMVTTVTVSLTCIPRLSLEDSNFFIALVASYQNFLPNLESFQHVGLALSSTLSSLVSLSVISFIFCIQNKDITLKPFITTTIKVLVAVILAISVVSIGVFEFSNIYVELVVESLLYTMSVFGVLALLRTREIPEVLNLFR